ncbi:MAG TPA: ABC transporter permease [Polyangiaceae bacterium]
MTGPWTSLWHAAMRVGAMAAKESTHIRRDPQTLIMALVMPVALLLLFGFGVTFDLEHLPIAAVDLDRTSVSRGIIQSFNASRDLVITAEVPNVEQGERLMRRMRAVAVVVIPEGFSRKLARGQRAELQLVVDGADASTATQTINKADSVAGRAIALPPNLPTNGVAQLVVDSWTLYNPAGRSALLLVPGLMAFILAMVCVLLTALTVAREWERGSMEQLFTTPIRRGELIIGKLLPYVGLGFLAVLLVLSVGAWVFGVPLHGSLLTLALAAFLFLIGMLAQGLFVSVITKNQMVATQVGTLTSMLPIQILSGFVFPIANMPKPLQVISQIMPATHFIAALRGILLRGNGFTEQRNHLLALFAFAFVMILVTSAKFRRQLD